LGGDGTAEEDAEEAAKSGKIIRAVRLSQAFTPAAPVGIAELFRGRLDQVMECTNALGQPGMHISVYGERGVGKTSLANVLPEIVNRAGQNLERKIVGIRVNCDTNDDFASLWTKVFREIKRDPEFRLKTDVDPELIRFELEGSTLVRLVVLDELDRLENDDALSLLADTIKTLADHHVTTTLMLVGVAQSLDELLGEHLSIVRSIVQVPMPRMSASELEDIIENGLSRASMTIQPEAKAKIVRLAEGLPHYIHQLCLKAGEHAIHDDRAGVSAIDVDRAIKALIHSHSLTSAYVKATRSNQPGSLVAKVLLACACAPKTDMGFFRASDVVGPFSAVMGKPATISAFARHLDELASDKRGNVLVKEGTSRHYEFRFADPLLQPFVKMASVANELVSLDLLDRLFTPQSVPSIPSQSDWPTVPELPFEQSPGASAG
jgi:Cdc6-like AAA superfamily ATPase